MYPSTLCSSFPKTPQGLNVMQHLSPVLKQNYSLFDTFLPLQADVLKHSLFLLKLCHCNGSCPSFLSMINKLDLKVDQHFSADQIFFLKERKKEKEKSFITKCLCVWMFYKSSCAYAKRGARLLVIDHFHVAVLLNPKLSNNDVVDTAGGVCPGVGFIISAEIEKQPVKTKTLNWWLKSN